jgi:hypothetical protein
VKGAVLVAVAMTLLRLPMAALLPLAPDEAYYWTWSQRLDWSYFDHPPMVAWGIAAFGLLGDSELMVRAFALFCGLVVTLALSWTARELAPEGVRDRAALTTALLVSAMPLVQVGAVIITPDSPAVGSWALALAALASVARGRSSAWYVAGAAMGFGLLSKYTVVLLGMSLGILLLLSRDWRRWLRTPHPWACAAIALLLFVPVVIWNGTHDWVSFRYQLSHGTSYKGDGGIASFFELAGAQIVIVTPMVIALVVLGLQRMRNGRNETGAGATPPGGTALLLASIAPTLVLFLAMSFKSRQETIWPAPAWLGAFVAAGVAAASVEWFRRSVPAAAGVRHGRLVRILYVSALLMCGVATALISIHPIRPVIRLERDRLRSEFHHWEALARTAASPRLPVLTDTYRTAAEVSYYGRVEDVGVARPLWQRRTMFDLWPPPVVKPGGDLVYVSDGRRGPPDWLIARFEAVDELPPPPRGRVWRLHRLKTNPGTTSGWTG